jgi:hypothetical protein
MIVNVSFLFTRQVEYGAVNRGGICITIEDQLDAVFV